VLASWSGLQQQLPFSLPVEFSKCGQIGGLLESCCQIPFIRPPPTFRRKTLLRCDRALKYLTIATEAKAAARDAIAPPPADAALAAVRGFLPQLERDLARLGGADRVAALRLLYEQVAARLKFLGNVK